MEHIKIKTEIPGPKSRAVLERREAAMPAGLARSTPVVVERSEGAVVWDADGNQLLDFAGGIGMLNAGHRPPEVVNAIKEQVDKSIHSCNLVATNEPAVLLCELLNRHTPGNFPKKTLLANSGAEAVENAVNISRYYTKRPAVIVFEGAYHGRTYLTMSMTSKYGLFKKGYGAFAAEIYRLPAPYPYRRIKGMSETQYTQHCIERLDYAMTTQVDPGAVAAMVIEPVQGEGGFIPMPEAFLKKIRSLCDAHDIVMIADEIQSGFGRTGKLFAIEHSGVIPDLITMAKSLGSGMPVSAVTGRAGIMDTPHPGAIGGTYSGSPVAAMAAVETIKLISQPAFLKRAEAVGALLKDILEGWKAKYSYIGDVRGVGGMRLVEFVKDRETREPFPELVAEIVSDAVTRGILLIRAGLFSNCIRLLPPFTITDAQLREGMAVLEGAVQRAHDKRLKDST